MLVGGGYQLLILLAIFMGSALLSTLLVRIGMNIALSSGFVAHSNAVLHDKRRIAMGGGIAFGIVILASTLLLYKWNYLPQRVPIALILTLAVGFIDDIRVLSPLKKLISLAAISCLYLLQTDINPLLFPVTLLIMLASQNAWNLVDVMDGLAGWISVVSFFGIAVIILLSPYHLPGILICSLVCAGAVLGFLPWNSPRARVFMGDTGSLTLGTLFGILIIEALGKDMTFASCLVVTGFIPFFETAFLITERTLKNLPIYLGSPDHFAIRLQDAGYSKAKILRTVIASGIGLIIFSSLIFINHAHLLFLVAIISVGCLVVIRVFRFLHCLPSHGEMRE
jgi:UDP-GlcNAc:undecaprenyl-phosphate GlcNAc-1-phosphate transferase